MRLFITIPALVAVRPAWQLPLLFRSAFFLGFGGFGSLFLGGSALGGFFGRFSGFYAQFLFQRFDAIDQALKFFGRRKGNAADYIFSYIFQFGLKFVFFAFAILKKIIDDFFGDFAFSDEFIDRLLQLFSRERYQPYAGVQKFFKEIFHDICCL